MAHGTAMLQACEPGLQHGRLLLTCLVQHGWECTRAMFSVVHACDNFWAPFLAALHHKPEFTRSLLGIAFAVGQISPPRGALPIAGKDIRIHSLFMPHSLLVHRTGQTGQVGSTACPIIEP